MHQYGFNFQQCENILGTAKATETKQFFSNTHLLFKDKMNFILQESTTTIFQPIYIEKNIEKVDTAVGVLLFSYVKKEEIVFEKNKNSIYVDADKLTFPLCLRANKTADYFYPFGMNGKKKKISKYFKDLKLNLVEKKETLLLFSGEKVCWLVGERMDNRFAVLPNTTTVLKIERQLSN